MLDLDEGEKDTEGVNTLWVRRGRLLRSEKSKSSLKKLYYKEGTIVDRKGRRRAGEVSKIPHHKKKRYIRWEK